MASVSILEVLLHGSVIGTYTQLPNDRNLFVFNQDYIEDQQRATLSLSFKDKYGELITDIRPTQTKVSPFFSNLLPEGQMREYLAQRAGVNAEREFFLLWVLGQDFPGAITIRPVDGDRLPPVSSQSPDSVETDQDKVLRFSLAGVQLKFSAVMEATGGLTIPVKGIGGSWIIKLPSAKYDNVPENEYAMMTLANNIGIDVPKVELIDVKNISGLPEGMDAVGGQAFVIERFDRREDGSRVHIEDFAQIFSVYPDKKYMNANYKNFAKVIWSEVGEEGLVEYIRRLVFNTLIGNGDMHLKNWSFIYPDRKNAALAPGYDFVSTIQYIPDEKMALNYSRTKIFSELTVDELSHLAAKARLPEKIVIDTALDTVERFNSVWKKEKKNLPISGKVVEIIDKHIKTIPLYSG